MIIFWQLLSILYFDLTLHCKKTCQNTRANSTWLMGKSWKMDGHQTKICSGQKFRTNEYPGILDSYIWHMYSCLCLRPENCRSKTQVSSKFNILRTVRWCYGDDVTLKMCFLCCHVENIPVMIGVGGRWGPVNVPWGGGVGTCSRSMWHANVTRQWLPMMLHWWCYDQAWSGCKAFIPKQLKVSQVWLNCTRLRASGAISMGKRANLDT